MYQHCTSKKMLKKKENEQVQLLVRFQYYQMVTLSSSGKYMASVSLIG